MNDYGSPDSSPHSGRDSPSSNPKSFLPMTKKQINHHKTANEGRNSIGDPGGNISKNISKHPQNIAGNKTSDEDLSTGEDSGSDEHGRDRDGDERCRKTLIGNKNNSSSNKSKNMAISSPSSSQSTTTPLVTSVPSTSTTNSLSQQPPSLRVFRNLSSKQQQTQQLQNNNNGTSSPSMDNCSPSPPLSTHHLQTTDTNINKPLDFTSKRVSQTKICI